VYSLAFAPNGRTLAAACFDGSVRIWRAESGDQVCRQALCDNATQLLSGTGGQDAVGDR
jgi:hypothetical protein